MVTGLVYVQTQRVEGYSAPLRPTCCTALCIDSSVCVAGCRTALGPSVLRCPPPPSVSLATIRCPILSLLSAAGWTSRLCPPPAFRPLLCQLLPQLCPLCPFLSVLSSALSPGAALCPRLFPGRSPFVPIALRLSPSVAGSVSTLAPLCAPSLSSGRQPPDRPGSERFFFTAPPPPAGEVRPRLADELRLLIHCCRAATVLFPSCCRAVSLLLLSCFRPVAVL